MSPTISLDRILAQRRSVRAFTSEPVPSRFLDAIFAAAQCAPSACNSQTWRFICVTDPQMIGRICKEAMRPVVPNRWLAQAPVVIVGCSRLDVVANRLGAAVTGIEYFQIDLGIAMEHMVLKATDLGLGSCWIGWFKEKALKSLLEIPDRIKVSALLAVGYPQVEKPKKRSRKAIHRIAFAEKWDNPWQFQDPADNE